MGDFHIRRPYRDRIRIRLCAANPKFRDILIAGLTDWEIWGKVIYSIRPH